MNRKERRAAEKLAARAGAVSRDTSIGHLFLAAIGHHQAGRLVEAERGYRDILELDPAHDESLNYLAILTHQSGDSQSAIKLLERAIEQNASHPEYRYNIALIFASLGRIEDAAEHYRRAIALRPDYADAHTNLAGTLLILGQVNEAVVHFRHALSHAPKFAQAHFNLAKTLLIVGAPDQALPIIVSGLEIQESQPLKSLFVQCAARMPSFPNLGKNRSYLLRALTKGWGRPDELAGAVASLIKQNDGVSAALACVTAAWPQLLVEKAVFGSQGFAAFARDPLLRAFLESAPFHDLELERLLTSSRFALLDIATGTDTANVSADVIEFACALAQQCFINDYVYALADAERVRAEQLSDALATASALGADVTAIALAAVAAYFPLHAVPGTPALAARAWPDAVKRLLVQQVTEPVEERQLRPTIAALTPVEDAVSASVRDQYEENPYPRWVKTVSASEHLTFDEHLHRLFPQLPRRNLGKQGAEILVAGCGTGQHSIETAQLAGTKVLALDLSLASLSYAKRKTRELGMSNVEYAQADILKLGAIGRSFDVIEAVGVLHHLRDPLEGWRVLLSLLRLGGFMRIGLYSTLARADVRAARALIAERGYRANTRDIRRCRQDIASSADGAFIDVSKRRDFFTLSGCRDLLFHVQEHQFKLPAIKTFLNDNNLAFIGFGNLDGPIAEEYRRRFPNDKAMTDLDNWNLLEKEYPKLFGSMYQFWLQKP